MADLSIVQPYVQIRQTIAGEWTTAPQLTVQNVTVAIAPTISSATLRYDYGAIDDGDGTLEVYPPLDKEAYLGWHIRLMIPETPPAEGGIPIWWGIITADANVPGGGDATEETGSTLLTARGLELLLARSPIDGSYIKTDSGPEKIDTVLPFNMPKESGPDYAIRGNRSTSRYDSATGATTYVFSDDPDDAKVWTAQDVIEYIVHNFAPYVLGWSISGATEILDAMTDIWIARRTIWDTLATVIDRRRGLTLTTYGPDPGVNENALIYVGTVFDEDITIGQSTLAACGDTAEIDADADEVGTVEIRSSLDNRYDKITVRGQPIILCGTLSWDPNGDENTADTQLQIGWLPANETAYKAAATNERTADKYDPVYTTLTVKRGTLPAGPLCKDDGTLDINEENAPQTYIRGKSFLRVLPLLTTTDDADAPPELRPPIVAAKIAAKYLQVDRLNEVSSNAPSMTVRMTDGTMGFIVRARPNYLLAKNHFAGAAEGAWSPLIDYEDIVATVAWASDSAFHYTVELETATGLDAPRTLIIDLPTAECWYRLANTATDVSGGALTIETEAAELRRDIDRLQTVAALARSWYQRARRAVTVNYHTLSYDLCAGDILTKIESDAGDIAVGTAITKVTWDCVNGTTTLETDYAELDFVAAAGVNRSHGPSLAAPSLSVPPDRADKDVNLPVRFASGGTTPALRMLVTYEANNHLVCDQLNATGDVLVEGVIVAKPPELRHQLKWYAGLTVVTTTDQNKVTVTDGTYIEKWIVRPPYIEDVTELAVMAVPDNLGWDLAGAVPQYLDLNVAGRGWAVDVTI